MDALVWILLPVFVAAGSALLSFYVMQAKMEVALARERESLASARATISSHEQVMLERVRSAEETGHRRAFDQFMAEIRVEERHYLRENKTMFLNRKSMILQERLYFRNIPLSNWVEHEMVVEEGSDLKSMVKSCSVFSSARLQGGQGAGLRPLLSEPLGNEG